MKVEREKVKEIDLEIVRLLCERFFLVAMIGKKKRLHKKSIIDLDVKEQRKQLYERTLGSYGAAIYEEIHKQSVKIQDETD